MKILDDLWDRFPRKFWYGGRVARQIEEDEWVLERPARWDCRRSVAPHIEVTLRAWKESRYGRIHAVMKVKWGYSTERELVTSKFAPRMRSQLQLLRWATREFYKAIRTKAVYDWWGAYDPRFTEHVYQQQKDGSWVPFCSAFTRTGESWWELMHSREDGAVPVGQYVGVGADGHVRKYTKHGWGSSSGGANDATTRMLTRWTRYHYESVTPAIRSADVSGDGALDRSVGDRAVG